MSSLKEQRNDIQLLFAFSFRCISTGIFSFSLLVVFLLSLMATAYTSEFLEIDLPIFGTYRFSELTSYYIFASFSIVTS